jgi:hypothetical protein
MGKRNNPEEEPPWVRGNLRVFGVSEVELGRVNKTIVDCRGLGDSTTIDRMCRRFLCGCFLDEAKIVSPGFQQPSSVSHPEAL